MIRGGRCPRFDCCGGGARGRLFQFLIGWTVFWAVLGKNIQELCNACAKKKYVRECEPHASTVQMVMAHPSTPKSCNLPNFINMDDKSPNDDQIDYDSDNDENHDETSKKRRRSCAPPEDSILFHCLEGVKERVRKGELMDTARAKKQCQPMKIAQPPV